MTLCMLVVVGAWAIVQVFKVHKCHVADPTTDDHSVDMFSLNSFADTLSEVWMTVI